MWEGHILTCAKFYLQHPLIKNTPKMHEHPVSPKK